METCTKESSALAAPGSGPAGAEPLPPLCVDLDGTLLRTDMLWETAVAHLKQHPLDVCKLPYWLVRGRAFLKQRLAEKVALDPATLPYTSDLLSYLQEQSAGGRTLVLVSGCDRRVGEQIADHLGIFGEVITSDGKQNVKGRVKAALLNTRFGKRGFDYAGNERADIPVWSAARSQLAANAPCHISRQLIKSGAHLREFGRSGGHVRAMVLALRCHQYAKNLLIFVPLFAAHAYFDWASLWPALLLFVAWCLSASGNYVFNDLLDLEADRRHPTKRFRPFASGDLPLPVGLFLAPVLLLMGLALAVGISPAAGGSLLLYLAFAFGYSFWLKKHPLVDVFALAFLFTIRVVGGGYASGHVVSTWLLAFSGFLFLGLAFLKRCSELIRIQALGRRHLGSRGYGVSDLGVLQMFGVASVFMAILVLGLYLNSTVAEAHYRWPAALWIVAPCVLLWVCRLWLATGRGEMHDDPLIYSFRDRVSWLMGLGVMTGFLLATLADPVTLQRALRAGAP